MRVLLSRCPFRVDPSRARVICSNHCKRSGKLPRLLRITKFRICGIKRALAVPTFATREPLSSDVRQAQAGLLRLPGRGEPIRLALSSRDGSSKIIALSSRTGPPSSRTCPGAPCPFSRLTAEPSRSPTISFASFAAAAAYTRPTTPRRSSPSPAHSRAHGCRRGTRYQGLWHHEPSRGGEARQAQGASSLQLAT